MPTRRPDIAVTRRGLMLVLSSPSGAGKTTLSRKLLDEDKGVTLSVSVTTRKIRPGEKDGRDYYFVDRKRFDAMVSNKELLEWAEVFDNYYGTPTKPVMDALTAGRDVLFDVDWQGTQQLRDKARGDLVSIFVLPPSIHELERRLRVTEPVIKFLTVRIDEEQKRLEKIKKLRDAKKKASAQPAASAEEGAAVPAAETPASV